MILFKTKRQKWWHLVGRPKQGTRCNWNVTQNLQVEKQVWMWSAAIEGRGRRGEVLSVMAALHNFWEREQKEGEGKWKAKRRGGVLVEEVRRGTAFFTSYTKWAEKWKHRARSLKFLKSTFAQNLEGWRSETGIYGWTWLLVISDWHTDLHALSGGTSTRL